MSCSSRYINENVNARLFTRKSPLSILKVQGAQDWSTSLHLRCYPKSDSAFSNQSRAALIRVGLSSVRAFFHQKSGVPGLRIETTVELFGGTTNFPYI